MTTPYALLRRPILMTRGIPILARFAEAACRAQLLILRATLGRSNAVEALILRRRGVLTDLYPGDSDYDLTCVAQDLGAAARVAKRVRWLKKFLPMVGE